MSLSRQQLTLLGIFALFFGPVLLVILMRSSWWQYQPSGLKNQGLLIQPPVHVALNHTQSFDGKWLILYVLDQPCDQACIDAVTALRQIHRAAFPRRDAGGPDRVQLGRGAPRRAPGRRGHGHVHSRSAGRRGPLRRVSGRIVALASVQGPT